MSKAKKQSVRPEWSHVIEADDIEAAPRRYEIKADVEVCAALAKRLGVLVVDSAEATLEVSRDQSSHIVYVQGTVEAHVQQACVVTLEPVEEEIHEELEAWFADPAQAVSLAKARQERSAKGERKEMPLLDERDDPEPIIDGQIDLGELAAQNIALGLNPYPHAEGVHYELGDEDGDIPKTTDIRRNPFAALKDWKKP